MKKILLAVLIAALSASVSMGAIQVYDSFSSAPNPTNPPAGWVAVEYDNLINFDFVPETDLTRHHGYVASNSLIYAGTTSTNNSFGLGNKTANYIKQFSPITLAGEETVYFSCLIRLNGGFTKDFNTGTLRLCDSTDYYGNGICIGVGTTNYLSNQMGFSLNNRQYNYFSDNSTNTADVYTMSNAVHFLVGSYTRGTNGNGSGTVSCWINPSISPTPGTPDLTVVSYQEDEDYDTIEIGCGGSGSWPGDWQFDELKVGTEWSDVVNADLPADTPPSALFTADPVTGTVPVSVTFTDLSGGTITNRLWDFGDGSSTNTDQLVFDHVYSTAGTYTVSLSLQGPQGTDSITMTNLISTEDPVAPTASFSADPLSGAVPVTVTFTDSSTGTITNRYWDFGDGATTNVTTAGVSYTYTNEGTYTVSLTVSGPVGTDTDTQVDLIEATGLGGGASIQMDADANDKGYRDDGSTIWVGQTEARVGTETAGTVTGLIIPFWVPALEGNSISDAELEVTYTQDTASFTAEANADVYAVRSDAASSVTVADDMTNTTATLVIDDYFEIGPGPLAGDKVTASSATLATWLDGEVGTVGEKWVFLRIIPDAVHSSGYKYARIATANTGTYPGAVLTITLGGGSGGPTNAPATFVISAAGALGSGSDVLNWTTEAGYIYSVWYSTNLLDGFQPLETNLDETVTSLTNNITTSPVFYKIEANW